MKPNELRIGNLILSGFLHTGIGGHEYYTVRQLSENMVFFMESNTGEFYKDIIPIVLTNEWLMRFGCFTPNLTKGRNLWVMPFATGLVFWFNGDSITLYRSFYTFPCRCVHQFQNIYFDKTGEELKLNL